MPAERGRAFIRGCETTDNDTMAEFNIRSDSVDVTRIMEQIRERIREKRGADYTEQQIHELATVKLESFLDPGQVRSDLVEHFRQLDNPGRIEPIPPHGGFARAPEVFDFDQETIYVSSRGPMGKLIRLIRKLLNPLLKLFFNPTPVVFALSRQAEINAWTVQLLERQTDLIERVSTQFDRVGKKFAAREELDALNYEVLNNLVVEMTRLSVDVKNHKMLVESVAGRLDFSERRSRALESVVQKRSPRPPDTTEGDGESADASGTGSGRTRRRRRRSRRRPEGPAEGDTNAARPVAGNGSGKATTPATPSGEATTPATPSGETTTTSTPSGETTTTSTPSGETTTAVTTPSEATTVATPEAATAPTPASTAPTSPADAASPDPPPATQEAPVAAPAPAPAAAPAADSTEPSKPDADNGTSEP